MHALWFQKRHPARVRVVERVGRGDTADGFLDRGNALRVLRNRGQGFLMVSQLGRIEREKRCEVRSVPGQVRGVHGDIIGWSHPYFIRLQAGAYRGRKAPALRGGDARPQPILLKAGARRRRRTPIQAEYAYREGRPPRVSPSQNTRARSSAHSEDGWSATSRRLAIFSASFTNFAACDKCGACST